MTEREHFEKLWELNDLVAELAKRKSHNFSKYSPQDYQIPFFKSTKHIRLITGGNRSGKSRTTAQELLYWLTGEHPWNKDIVKSPKIWVISPEYRTIYWGIWTHIRDNIPDWHVKKFGSKVPGWDIPSFIETKNGGRLEFISAESGDDRKKLQAAAIDLICIDEEVSYDLVHELEMRLLDRDGKIIIGATLIRSEEWITNLIDSSAAGDPDVDHWEYDTNANKYVSEKAKKRVKISLPDDEYEVRILGKSRRTKGLIYSKFSQRQRQEPIGDKQEGHIIAPFELPKSWLRFMCLDAGYRVGAALWGALTPPNPVSKLILYREMYCQYGEAAEWVEFIRNEERHGTDDQEQISLRLEDPADFAHNRDGSPGIAIRLAEDYDLDFIPGFNDKATNIFDVRSLLFPLDDPKLLVFGTLTNFIREIKKYKIKESRDKKNLDEAADRPVKKHDHLMNCLEYMASQRTQYMPEQSREEQLREMALKDDSEIVWADTEEARRTQNIMILRERKRMQTENIERVEW